MKKLINKNLIKAQKGTMFKEPEKISILDSIWAKIPESVREGIESDYNNITNDLDYATKPLLEIGLIPDRETINQYGSLAFIPGVTVVGRGTNVASKHLGKWFGKATKMEGAAGEKYEGLNNALISLEESLNRRRIGKKQFDATLEKLGEIARYIKKTGSSGQSFVDNILSEVRGRGRKAGVGRKTALDRIQSGGSSVTAEKGTPSLGKVGSLVKSVDGTIYQITGPGKVLIFRGEYKPAASGIGIVLKQSGVTRGPSSYNRNLNRAELEDYIFPKE